ncbi:MAG: 50S ribosomal protein L3 [Patescibacteria group bacterium]
MSVGFAKKIGMTRLFLEGKSRAVTVLEFKENFVLQKKVVDKDGYNAIQVGSVKKKKGTAPRIGHVRKYSSQDFDLRFIGEFRDFEVSEDKSIFDINDFEANDVLDISGSAFGRGFAGVVKWHSFRGQPASRGHDHERAPGSIGSRWPQRVLPGRKMAGHMGTNTVTLKNVKVLAVDPELGLLFVNGSVPGSNSNYLKIRKVEAMESK